MKVETLLRKTKFVKEKIEVEKAYDEYKCSEIGNEFYERGAFVEGFDYGEKQFKEVPDHEAELAAMLEECKKSFDWVFENCTPPVITDEESVEDMIHFIFYRIQELDSLIQKLKSDE